MLFVVAFTANTFAATWYVSATNGRDDIFPGTTQAQPYQTIYKALSASSDGDVIVIFTDTYNESNNIPNNSAIPSTTPLNITKAVTFQILQTPSTVGTAVLIPGGIVISSTTSTKTVTFQSGIFNYNLGTGNALNLVAGTLDNSAATILIGSGATVARSAGSITTAPTFGDNTSVTYSGTSDYSAGPELPANLGTGTLSIGLTGKTLTIGASITFSGNPGHITLTSGNANLTGTVTFSGAVLAGSTINNSGAGVLTFANAILYTPSVAQSSVITNSAAGTLVLNGGVSYNTYATVGLNNTGTGLVNLGANVTFAGAVNNLSLIQVNSNILTLSGASLNNTGEIYSSAVGKIGGGTVLVTSTGLTTTTSGILPNLTITGQMTLGSNAQINGNFTLSSSTVGAFNDGNHVLSVAGNFNRTDNTIGNYTANNTLTFNGPSNQLFNPGASLTLNTVSINNVTAAPNNVITMGASVVVTGDFTITAGRLNLSDYNITMTGTTGQTFTNGTSSSYYSSTGNGYLIMQGNLQKLAGAGVFGNMLINPGGTATVSATANIKFSGILVLYSGNFDVGAHNLTLTADNVPIPTIRVKTDTFGALTSTGTISCAANVVYNLEYFGAYVGTYTTANEWIAGSVNNLWINTTGPTTVSTPNVDSNIAGTLTVNALQTLTSGAHTYTLSGAGMAHSIPGKVTGIILNVTGSGSSITGSTVTANAASIADLVIAVGTSGTFTSTNLKSIGNLTNTSGTSAVTTNATTASIASLTVTAGNLTLTMGSAAAQQIVSGGATLTAGTLTLGSNVLITGTTSQVDGNIAAGSFKYIQKGAASNYTRSGAGTFTNGTLSLDATSGIILLTPGTTFVVPNLEAVGTAHGVTVGASMEVSNSLLLDNAGTFTQNTGVLKVSGNTFTVTDDAGAFFGAVTLTGAAATFTLGQDYTIQTLTINTSGTVSLVTSDLTTPAYRTLTVSNLYTNTAGTFSTDGNNLTITPGSFTFTAGAITQGAGILTWNGTGVNIPASGFAIDNLTIQTATNVSTNAFTVNKALVLSNTLTTSADGKLTLGGGALVTRTGNAFTLSNVPTFAGAINLDYKTFTGAADISTANEAPASVNNLTVESNAKGVILTANINITGTLSLASYLKALPNTKVITMADGSILELKALGTTVLDQDVTKAGVMGLVYNGDPTTSRRELGVAVSGAYPVYAGNVTVKANVAQDNITTWNGSFTFDGGNYDLVALAANIGNSVATTKNGGNFVNSGAAAFLNFTAATNATLGLYSSWTVPSTVKFRLNTANNATVISLSGGNLDFATNSSILYFVNGILSTGTAVVILRQDDNSVGNPTQGFDRSGVTGTNISHVQGNVKKYLDATGSATGYAHHPAVALTRVEFPVGSAPVTTIPTAPAYYKPMAYQFTTLPTANFNLTVNEVESNPLGTVGFPITSGTLQLANYPNFYWLVTSDLTLQPQVLYDIEAEANGYGPINYPEGIANVRFLRRFDTDVNNPWLLQGGAGYDNSTNVDHAKIIVRSAEGAISTQGARFTYSQVAKSPSVTTAAASVTVATGTALTVKWTAASLNLGGTATINATPVWTATAPAVVPTNAAFSNGTLTWTPTYSQVGVYTIAVTAVDGTLSTTNTVTITVTTGAPSFTTAPANASASVGKALTLTYTAVFATGDVVTYTVAANKAVSAAATITAAGAFSWTPAISDIALSPVTFTVTAKSSVTNLTATATTAVTVGYGVNIGDVNGDGSITAADASLILQEVVGLVTFTDLQKYAADVNVDGKVGALDAAWVLYYAINGKFPPTSKTAALAGSASFGRSVANNELLELPISIQNTNGVQSFYAEINLGANVTFKSVKASLPEGWQVASNMQNGVLKIAMAGINSLTDGNLAVIELSLKSKESVVSIQGLANLNDALDATMQPVQVREIPNNFSLSQNYPNPFNPTTNINYSIPQDASVKLTVYNSLGQIVKTMVDAQQKAGYYSVRWDGSNDMGSKVSSGMYIYRITAGSFTHAVKMNLIK